MAKYPVKLARFVAALSDPASRYRITGGLPKIATIKLGFMAISFNATPSLPFRKTQPC
jgi:hypothetical protein